MKTRKHMKLLCLRTAVAFAAIVLTALTGAAQQHDLPFADTARPDRTVRLGVHVTEGLSTVLQNYGKAIAGASDFSMTPGNRLGIGVTAVMPVRNFIGIGTGIDFVTANNYWTMTLLDRNSGTLNTIYTRNHYYSLNIPAFIDLNFNAGSRAQWHTEAGIYVDLGLGGKNRVHSYASYTNDLGQSQVTETRFVRDYYNDKNPIVNGVAKTDWGLHLASGFTLSRHWSLMCAFQVGARQLARNRGVLDVKNRNLSLAFRAGYIF